MNEGERIFKEKLEGAHTFPGLYTFKFIVRSGQQAEVEKLVEGGEVKLTPSSGNKYVSVTISAEMNSSEEVIAVYKAAKEIEGIISL